MTDFQWFLVEQDPLESTTTVRTFPGTHERRAYNAYRKREKQLFPWTTPTRVCLFRAPSLAELRFDVASWFHEHVEIDGVPE